MSSIEYKPGMLVTFRERDWVVMPSDNSELLLLKPLGGSEEEMTGVFKPLHIPHDAISIANFPLPVKEDIGELGRAEILYNAARLSFRNGAGPFRSLAKLSFRPRAYQMVPMFMALKQEKLRLMIADDVGVGKTLEALLIVKELLERKTISSFAVVCLPHLCDQWQQELKDKFGIEAVIIRSNTQARLDRDVPSNVSSVYKFYPYQIVSIDFIKGERKQNYVQDCPQLIIVDEAHTCAKPEGQSNNQQQRFSLLHEVSKTNRHMLLLTATPHSGKQSEFQSLLGLLNPKFALLDLPNASDVEKKELASHFIQRRRGDILRWLNEDTKFPKRESGEYEYELSQPFKVFYNHLLDYVKGLAETTEQHRGRKKLRYFTALALLRGAMSSPPVGLEMLNKRLRNEQIDEELFELGDNPNLDSEFGFENDATPDFVAADLSETDSEKKLLHELIDGAKSLSGVKHDWKLATAMKEIRGWIELEFQPVVFCRYIRTAEYVGEAFKAELQKTFKNIDVQVITGNDPDEVRKQRVDEMSKSKQRVLIATDCLSEGINLQNAFNAVLHYDLPWNPNRLEQREGRVDRFGQECDDVKAYLLYGKDNPIDGVVLQVILRKIKDIRRDIGISIPFPEDSKSVMDAVLNAVLLNPKRAQDSLQMTLEFGEANPIDEVKVKVSRSLERSADYHKKLNGIFTQYKMNPSTIEPDLKLCDDAIGNPQAVEHFVTGALTKIIGAQIQPDKNGYRLFTANLPMVLKTVLPTVDEVKVSFSSPTPSGYLYFGRNHLFTEQLCQYLLANAIKHNLLSAPARASVERCNSVEIKTTIILFRVRNVIEDIDLKNQLVAEEMLVWGYRGNLNDKNFIESEEAMRLLSESQPAENLSPQAKQNFLLPEVEIIKEAQKNNFFSPIAEVRVQKLIEAHERFRKVTVGSKFQQVKPVLPMDVLGVYILLPVQKTNS